MERLIDITAEPVASILPLLLQDKSTKKKIIWATDTYAALGPEFTDKVQLDADALLCRPELIRPRIEKSIEAQAQRTRKRAEVFTPAWLCNRMNNLCDADWFGRPDVFNTEHEDHTWMPTAGKIAFPAGKTWEQYVDSRRLEITCGEAPYLVSRYDVSTGSPFVMLSQRIGLLDRKLRVVGEKAAADEEWLKWAIRAVEATYGYEYQGDNVLMARINLLLTFVDYYRDRFGSSPDAALLQQIAGKIVWNLWQMDGLKDTVPLGKPYEPVHQITMFEAEEPHTEEAVAVPCKVMDWRSKKSIRFGALKER